MIDLNKINEKYMWQVELNNGAIINEFIETNNGEIIETPFSEVNKNDEFKELRLVSSIEEFKGLNISLDNKGQFQLIDRKFSFYLYDTNNKDVNLLDDKAFNNLMMYRQNYMTLNSEPIIYSYNIGYKIDNDNIFARVKLINSIEGIKFRVEITGKRDFEADLMMKSDMGLSKATTVNIQKNNTINIDIN